MTEEQLRQTIAMMKCDKEELLEACRIAYEELGKDKRWHISDLRLKVLGGAISKATK
jgi:uncharacterized protein YeeX (DUF496 family)